MTAPTAIIRSLPVKSIAATSNIRLSNGHDKESLSQLADSIKTHGLIQPIVVRQADEGEGFEFCIVAGRRRLAATKLAGLETIPAIVSATDEADAYQLEIAENIQREQMTLADTARAVRTLMLIHDSAKKVAAIVNKSPAWVSKHLTITSNTFSAPAAAMLDSGLVQDLETLLLVNQIHKHPEGSHQITRMINLAAQGQLNRQIAQDALAKLKGPKGPAAPPPPVSVTRTQRTTESYVSNEGADPKLTFTVELPVRYMAEFEERGGVEWVVHMLEFGKGPGGHN